MSYDQLADTQLLDATVTALQAKNYIVDVVGKPTLALDTIKLIIPEQASVMNGASRSLEQIGFIDYLKSNQHPWQNFHQQIVAETDPAKQAVLRKQATLSDYYLGSVHALISNGEFIIASNTGSQLPNIVYNSPNLIFVVGTQKIVTSMTSAIERLEKYIIPLEDQRMHQQYGTGTAENKLLIFKGESPLTKRQIHFILVEEVLGF